MASSVEHEPYRHYSATHRVVAWFSQRVFDRLTYTVNHGILKGMRRRGGLGWVPEWVAGSSESAEHEFFRRLDLSGKVVYDVGAFIGLFAMHCSRTAREVVCYEPMEQNRTRLRENLALNRLANVRIRPYGVGSVRTTLRMTFDPLMPGGATVSPELAEGIGKAAGGMQQLSIDIRTLDEDVAEASLPAPDLIKIDIEGFELDALRGASRTLERHTPDLYLEMHGETMADKRRKAAAIVDFLEAAGYASLLHVESATLVTGASSEIAATGHLFCRHRPPG